MKSIDLQVLYAACDWLAQGHRVALVTVVQTWGSSPRPAGAMMALQEGGRVVGSVSGGCIEDDLLHRCTTIHGNGGFPQQPTEIVRYGINAEEAYRFGLPCGGTIELLIEFSPSLESLRGLIDQLESGKLVQRSIRLEDGLVTLVEQEASTPLCRDAQYVSFTMGPEYRMLLIGAGVLAEYLSTMALFNGFLVSICDPRTEYMDAWTVNGVEKLTTMPDDAVRDFRPDSRTCIITLSHDPKLDDLAILEALRSNAFYVGAIGSRRNSDKRRERLIEHFGETQQTLARLRCPVGLYLGSKTPAEIAVSIMAEVIAVKNGVDLPKSMAVSNAKALQDAGAGAVN